MNSKRPFAPKFISDLDHYLLRNQPVAWTCRTHLVMYYSLVFSTILALLCFIIPTDARSEGFSFEWTAISIIATLIAFIVWVIYLLRFNVFKRFGIDKKWNGLKVFVLFFISISFMILPCFIPSAVETIRANRAYSYKEIIDDVNAINTKINQLYYDSLNHKWKEETCIVRDTLPNDYITVQPDVEPVEDPDVTVATPIPLINYIDTVQLKTKLSFADSVVKVNDSTYKFFECPDYAFLDNNNLENYRFSLFGYDFNRSDSGLWTSLEIYERIIKNFKAPERKETETELQQLIKKYKKTTDYNYDYNDDDDRYSIHNRIRGRYHLGTVSYNISNILDKKFRYHSHNDSRIRLWFYFTLALTLLAFIFRHSTPKTFFLSILTCIILFILTLVFSAFTDWTSTAFFYTWLFYFAGFTALAIAGSYESKRGLIGGIALNIITFFTASIPLVLLGLVYEYVSLTLHVTPEKTIYTHWSKNKDLYFLIAEISGIVLLFILIEPFFKRLYRNWFSKPEE